MRKGIKEYLDLIGGIVVHGVYKKFFLSLIFMLFIIGKSFSVLAFDLDDERIVAKDKIWTITFNRDIMLDEFSYENVSVIGSDGQKVSVILELSEAKNILLVKSPTLGYEIGAKYELTVSDKIQSIEGDIINKPASIMFVIGNPVYIAKVNNINLSINEGQAYTPQKTVTVDYNNGVRQQIAVIWDKTTIDTTKPGVYILKGKVIGYESQVTLTLKVLKAPINYDQLVKASPVIAVVPWDSNLYKGMATSSGSLALIKKGTKVEVIRDVKYKWYYIKTSAGKYGWIESGNLTIPKDPATNANRLSKENLEGYVNVKGFKSNTKYFMWVDLDRQTVNIFGGTEGKYKLINSMSCATGRNISPTTRGFFAIQNRGEWFFTGSSGAKNWVGFNGQYLFHSIIMDENKNVKDYTLGKRASAGCIRLAIDNSKWVYDNIPFGTTVWVN
jgi:lipoprotein-anchoring transpeptidase ErfK/SrfK